MLRGYILFRISVDGVPPLGVLATTRGLVEENEWRQFAMHAFEANRSEYARLKS